jgi:hypothetical protein
MSIAELVVAGWIRGRTSDLRRRAMRSTATDRPPTVIGGEAAIRRCRTQADAASWAQRRVIFQASRAQRGSQATWR